jgi:hypothetical protein
VLGGFVDGDQPLPRRLLDYATQAASTWCPRQTSENAARSLVAWTREGGAVRALLVVSVSLYSAPIGGLASLFDFVSIYQLNAFLIRIMIEQL